MPLIRTSEADEHGWPVDILYFLNIYNVPLLVQIRTGSSIVLLVHAATELVMYQLVYRNKSA
jgi:hypothetical protein